MLDKGAFVYVIFCVLKKDVKKLGFKPLVTIFQPVL